MNLLTRYLDLDCLRKTFLTISPSLESFISLRHNFIKSKLEILCKKLDVLQFEKEIEKEFESEKEIEKTELKPAPHFEVLKEEGKKLEVKVRFKSILSYIKQSYRI